MKELCFIFLLAILSAGCSAGPLPDKKPNVLFLLVDDLGWMDVGIYGSHLYETPNIDRLARGGMRFTSAYAAASVCSPTRASLLTGKYPARLGLTDWIPGRPNRRFQPLRSPENLQHLPHGETTIAEDLRSHGYATHFIGKWHLGGEDSLPTDHGFMTNVGGSAMGNPGADGYFSPYNIELITDTTEGEYLTKRMTDEALRVIEESGEEPFFLLLSFYTVHSPLQAPDSLIAYYEGKLQARDTNNPEYVVEQNPDMPAYDESTWEEKQAWSEVDSLFAPMFDHLRVTRVRRRQNHPVYAAMVHFLDHSVGRILDKLDAAGIADDTIVVFYSDNGGQASHYRNSATSSAPLRGGKGWLYEGGIRVPLIIRWPNRIEAESENASIISSPDLYPTLLSMTQTPAQPGQHVDGMNVWGAVRDGEAISDRAVFWHWPHYSNHGEQSPGGAVRQGRYKLIEYYENGTRQLFDLDDDVEERRNLIDRRPALADSLARLLRQWRMDTGARMPFRTTSTARPFDD